MSMSKEQRFDIPEDIVVTILIRLPVKSLVRFSCVSKRWRSIIISDPKFAESHFQLALQRKTLSRRILIETLVSRGSIPRFQSLEDDPNGGLVKSLTFPSEENSQGGKNCAKASCNGLVLLLEKLSIWNPSTGFVRKIPNPSFELGNPSGGIRNQMLKYGFGHVSATDDYTIVCVVLSAVSVDSVEVHVFSLKANSWKVVCAPYSSFPDWFCQKGTLSNGAFHWAYDSSNSPSDKALYAFDLAKDELRQLPLPVSLQEYDVSDLYTLALFGGCLCLLSVRQSYNLREIWQMREYGVPGSWVKLYQFCKNDLQDVGFSCYYYWSVSSVIEGGTLVITLFDKDQKKEGLVMIECCKEEKPVCSGRYRIERVPAGCNIDCDAITYDETLISVPQ